VMMLAKILAVVLVAEAVLCQENVDPVRRLRFRRPRPKLIDVDNPDGDLRGSPVELRLAESEVSAAVAEESQPTNFRDQNRGSAALDALIATAQREKPAPVPQPQVLEIEEIPTQRPLRLSPAADQRETAQFREEAPARPQRVRQRGGVPNRRRPRPEGQEPGRGEGPRRRPNNDREREEPIETLERYSHKNEDGSFTFGYVGADGSFREETRGADCITRGKYGYIDPDGVKREYTYTSGLPCNTGDDSDLQNLDGDNVEDPINPRERFRQTQNEQLTDDQIPQAARPRRPIQRRPAEAAPVVQQANTFSNFGGNAQRAQIPERRPTATRVSQASGNALQSLQAIANGAAAQAAPVSPAPTRKPVRIQPRPTQASRPAAPANQGTFDFDAELEGFTLNRPSITFEQNRQNQAAAAAPNSFQSQLSFNQNTGTFNTNLQQNIQGGQQISLSNNNAPSGAATTASPQLAPIGTTFANTRPSPRPTTIFQNSTPRPAPTAFPARANPSPTPQGSRTIVPSGTFQLGFEPLNFPDIAAVKVNLPPPTPAQIKLAPTPAPTQRPTPAPVQIRTAAPTQRPTLAPTQRPTQPPTQRPTPVRINLTEAPRQSQPIRIASPTPAAPLPAAPSAPVAPAAPTSPAAPANTFFVFQPFSQQPASAPFRTPVNQNAFQVSPNQPRPAQQRPVQPRPVQPRPVQPRPVQPQAARPIQPQPTRPLPQVPQRVPIPQSAAPQQAGAPQLQFGFSPVQQQPQRPAPPQRPAQPQQLRPQQPRPAPPQFQQRPQAFTAFGGQQQVQARPPQQQQLQARPPPRQQLQARPPPQQQLQARPPPQQFQGRPQQFQQPQLGIPPQLQQQRPGAPQFAQFDSRFAPRPQGQAPGQVQFRPAQFQPGQQQQPQSPQFSVFNPAQQLRGA